ncbi:hypothetical protein GCM10023191_088050 [Actinoallomurus oryzae]|uniref:Zinc-finger domain-containing protein n=1 Tax=Actinoallomurus oryzae TaxID=502180 RepID=A0ABP8R2Z9_9ACTN
MREGPAEKPDERALADLASGCLPLLYNIVAADWDGRPAPLWRKRFARHIRGCTGCSDRSSDLIPAERLLASLPLVPVPLELAHASPGAYARLSGTRVRHVVKARSLPVSFAATCGRCTRATTSRSG